MPKYTYNQLAEKANQILQELNNLGCDYNYIVAACELEIGM